MSKKTKVLHAQYKFNTNVARGGNEQDYVVVYLENNATDVMLQGYTQVPREHIHTQGDLNDKDTAMDAFKKLDSAIRNRYFSHENGTSSLKVNNNFTIDEQGVLGLNIVQLENRAAYNMLETKDDKAIYVWLDNGQITGANSGTPGNPDTGISPITPSLLSSHNTSSTAHQDIRNLIESLTRTLDDTTTKALTNENKLSEISRSIDRATTSITELKKSGIDYAKLAERSLSADKLSNTVTINGTPFDGSRNISINSVEHANTANTATKLSKVIHINGIEFDGSHDINITTSAAESAVKLTTPVNINGVSFDGSKDINITRVANSDNADRASRLARAVHINGVEFDGSADITIPMNNATTANKLAAAVNINGVAFDGSRNIDITNVANANRANTADKLSKTIHINGIEFDGSKDITIPASAFTGLSVDNSNRLGGKAADEYALKKDVYTKQETYSKGETYSKQQIDAKSGYIPGGYIYIAKK